MKRLRLIWGVTILVVALMASSAAPLAAAPFANRTTFADPRFAAVWARTDGEAVRGGRTWYWGPGPWFDYAEFYRQSPNSLRTVQYLDKARMEINNPADGIVTNGLLVKELISGRIQLGDDPYDAWYTEASDVPVAGNPRAANTIAPGYRDFAGIATLDNGYRDPSRLNERVSTVLARGGNLSSRSDLARPETTIVQYNSVTGHNIPRVFWEFMNQRGRIVVDGRVTTGPIVDWLFAIGYPITDPYWTRAVVGESERDVLVQLFERRVLTYTPDNPPAYQVEMGNVGQHYFQWRYPHLGMPWAAPDPATPLIYASNIDTGSHWELYRATFNGGGQRLTTQSAETVAFSWRRSWDPVQQQLVVDSRRADLVERKIYLLNAAPQFWRDAPTDLPARRRADYIRGHAYNAMVSPDGHQVLFVREDAGVSSLQFGPLTDRALSREFPLIPSPDITPPHIVEPRRCAIETPTWSPDGRAIYWVSNCEGSFAIYRADLEYAPRYTRDRFSFAFAPRDKNVRKLSDGTTNDRFARVSPDGRLIAFASDRDGNWEIYVMNSDGSNARRLTNHPAVDEAPTWSPDGTQLAFASDRDGDFEIYILNVSDGIVTQQVTQNTAQDRWPLWAQ